MSDVVIRAEGLGKRYHIGERNRGMFRYGSLRDSLASFFTRRSPQQAGQSETIWALKDVSFEIKRGEVVGIIGRNGAGKSTLLKILSRITEPTEGFAEIHGRVGSLLEVGTGFHPELTGRENIFLNGAILGMRKAEIAKKFDEIVAFAEVEKFIDTPVKHYSSGMYVRLAFAVAAHLQPEILVVDEVLAVGDLEFQRKCIGRMEKVAKEGRTVAIVSHNMGTVRSLCTRGILLDRGVVRVFGAVDGVIGQYLSHQQADSSEKLVAEADHLTGLRQVRVMRVQLANGVMDRFAVRWLQPIQVRVEVEVRERVEEVSFGAGIKMPDDSFAFFVHHDDHAQNLRWVMEPGIHRVEFTLNNFLKPGIYKLCIGAHHHHYTRNLFHIECVNLEVLDHSEQGWSPLPYNPGLVSGTATWKLL